MTLQESIKTGLPFKRKINLRWILWGRPRDQYIFTVDEVMANDWHIKDEEIIDERYDELKHDVKTLLHCLINTESYTTNKSVRDAVEELKWVIQKT